MTDKIEAGSTGALYDRLLEDLATGTFEGGQRLKINDLAERYGTSSNPIREVLRQLQGEGFVDITQNRGARVHIADADTVRDIHEILQMLEPYFCSWFAEFATVEQLDQLDEIQNAIEDLEMDANARSRFRALDAQFHSIIHQGHYNKRALKLWENLRRGLRIYTNRLPLSAPRLKVVSIEHRALISAFRANDSDAAREIQKRHIAGSGELIYKQMRAP